MQLIATGTNRDKLTSARAGVLWRLQGAITHPWQRQRSMAGRPDMRRAGLFSAAMNARLLKRLDADMVAAHGILIETPSVQNTLDKLREQHFLWRSQRRPYAVEDAQFLERLAQDDQTPSDLPINDDLYRSHLFIKRHTLQIL